jgi:hypothetical protein
MRSRIFGASEGKATKRIERYSFGSIAVDGTDYSSDLIIYPDRIRADWWRKEGHVLHVEDLTDVLDNPPEVLVVGQGDPGRMRVDPAVAERLEKLNVQLVAAPTKVACERFNDLSRQGRSVVAALHLTC